jgi:lysyl-tRNA synthetase class 2
MELTEQMVSYAAEKATGSTKVTYQGQVIDFTPPWNRLEMRQGLLNACGVDINECRDAETLSAALKEKGIEHPAGSPRGKLIDWMVDEYLEKEMIQPTFLYNYPREISPLAKAIPGDPQTVERFEGFVAGMELCNAFTELNDPIDQEARFLEMGRDYEEGDEDQHPMDEDYLRAMRYGMPPNGGFGMGIDRLVMLLTDKHSIREVLLFPHLRAEE